MCIKLLITAVLTQMGDCHIKVTGVIAVTFGGRNLWIGNSTTYSVGGKNQELLQELSWCF